MAAQDVEDVPRGVIDEIGCGGCEKHRGFRHSRVQSDRCLDTNKTDAGYNPSV